MFMFCLYIDIISIIHENICFEGTQQQSPDEYSQHLFSWRNKKPNDVLGWKAKKVLV